MPALEKSVLAKKRKPGVRWLQDESVIEADEDREGCNDKVRLRNHGLADVPNGYGISPPG